MGKGKMGKGGKREGKGRGIGKGKVGKRQVHTQRTVRCETQFNHCSRERHHSPTDCAGLGPAQILCTPLEAEFVKQAKQKCGFQAGEQ